MTNSGCGGPHSLNAFWELWFKTQSGTQNPGFPRVVPPLQLPGQSAAPVWSTTFSPQQVTAGRPAASQMWCGRTRALLRVSGLWPKGVLGRRPLNCSAASLAGSNSPRCWNCGGLGGPLRGDRFFCPQCRALQPPDPTRDYFSLMDW